ncbi:hypothetical protein N9P94_00180 [Pseudomonadales bacterium]|nr:hypothetical protein [Pseudomonadales bacterium]
MSLQKVLLKWMWPGLKFIDLKRVGGFYTHHGEDTFLMTALYGLLERNTDGCIVEIDKSEDLHFSLTTIMVSLKLSSAVLVNSAKNLMVSFSNPKVGLSYSAESDEPEYESHFGCNSSQGGASVLYGYKDQAQLIETISTNFKLCNLVITSPKADSLKVLWALVDEVKVFAVFLVSNQSGLFSAGDMAVRRRLNAKGYIYYGRLNGKDDLFLASEMINGFPSKCFEKMGTTELQKWITPPPGSIYTDPV